MVTPDDSPISHTAENSAEGGVKMAGLKGGQRLGQIVVDGAGGAMQADGTAITSRAVVNTGRFITGALVRAEEVLDVIGLGATLGTEMINQDAYNHCTCQK